MARRVVVVGTGAIGGFFGGVLARAGADVTFIARGATVAALRSHGLTIRSPEVGNFTVMPAVTDDPRGLEPPDLVLFCVKTYDLEAAAERIRPLVWAGTVVLPLQNGIDATERLARLLGESGVLVGVTYVNVTRSPATVIDHTASRRVIVGEPRGGLNQPVTATAELGVPTPMNQAIYAALKPSVDGPPATP